MKITSRAPAFYRLLPLFLVFFAVPYLFDLAFCEELYATQLTQAALIDAEKADPSDGESSSLDSESTSDVKASPPRTYFLTHSSFETRSVRVLIPAHVTARPPPAS